MNFSEKTAQLGATGVYSSEDPEGFMAIYESDCAAAIWERAPLRSFQSWIDSLPAENLPKTRTILRPERVREALQDLVELCGTPDCPEREMLVDDVAALAAIFADVMQTPYVRLRLDVITTNACRKFHIDALTARLVCTYRGTGTQYGNSSNLADPDQYYTVPSGSPVILRGTRWPISGTQDALVHRSPPIEGTGETRLLLVLDSVTDLEAEPVSGHATIH